ncbi:hypothetical protein FB451DRAFT_1561928 [Mycena latifolia]|nr:hypothetical protein FB451DRAFT_1561928 [Mycena latifolia]
MPTMVWIAATSHWFSHPHCLPLPRLPRTSCTTSLMTTGTRRPPNEAIPPYHAACATLRHYHSLSRRRTAHPRDHEAQSHALPDCGIAQVASAIRCITLDQHYGCALHATPART